ncbi:MAG: hypothetical protein WA118_02955 [Carboxydocellales bacterium]
MDYSLGNARSSSGGLIPLFGVIYDRSDAYPGRGYPPWSSTEPRLKVILLSRHPELDAHGEVT